MPLQTDENFDADDLKGCILAHAMGLGKSIQSIAFLHTFHAYHPDKRSLLLVPANVLINWKQEAEKWLPATVGHPKDSPLLIIERVCTLPFDPLLHFVSRGVRGVQSCIGSGPQTLRMYI